MGYLQAFRLTLDFIVGRPYNPRFSVPITDVRLPLERSEEIKWVYDRNRLINI